MRRVVCIHGHYYQPPREHPWLGIVEPEPSAAPERDWNARILRECYAANAEARVLDTRGRLRGLVDNYAWTSFDVGPTLAAWMGQAAPGMLVALRRADAESVRRTGHGNAWAQAYNHPILPLCSDRDLATQVRWGAREFRLRFGRDAEGMWLPEMAVDVRTLEALAAAGIVLTMLSPHQARRVRPLGAADGAWRDVTPGGLDVRKLHRCRLPSGAYVDVVFREPDLSQGLAYGELLRDGGVLATRLRAALEGADGDAIVAVATDGETFGHHHHFGEMALAYAIERLRASEGVELANPAAFRAAALPTDEVEIVPDTSWSCAHGIERWRSDCPCGSHDGWSHAWRGPLRAAVDWLAAAIAPVFEREGGTALRDPWGARERYVDCVVEPERLRGFLDAELVPGTSGAGRVHARTALELARHALLMQTSCGWFFDDVAGLEAVLVMRQAGRAIALASRLGADLEGGFVDRLAAARSNVEAEGSGADVYRRAVHGRAVTPGRIGATAVLLRRLGEAAELPGYAIAVDGESAVTVTEDATGAVDRVGVGAVEGAGGRVRCRVGETTYGVADLFLVQREALLRRAAAGAVAAVGRSRAEALARLRDVIDPLLERAAELPLDLAVLLGYDEAEALTALAERRAWAEAVGRATAARRRGVVLPAQWLARRLAARLERFAAALPDGTADAHGVLDVADAAGTVLDLEPAQVAVARWWIATRPHPASETLLRLRDRLALSPEL